MSLSHRLEYWTLIAVARFLCIIPRQWAFQIGHGIGRLAWALGIRKKLVLSNIAQARPDADEAELNRIGRAAASNFGRTTSEFIRYGIKDRDIVSGIVKIEGLEELRETLSQGKGALLLSGHFSSWVIHFAAISLADIPLSLLIGRQHNQKVDEFISKIPGDRVEMINKGRAAVRSILAKLNEGRAIVFASDQHAGKGGLILPFLGKNASTLPLPGSISAKHDVPVFTMFGHRNEDGTHLVKIEPMPLPGGMTKEEHKVEVMRRYNIKLGEIVSEHPEHYFWYHRRWREESETPVS
ncbi:lysophospholipid acyltransferase family protein [Pelagicoccus mobilis]|uniref:Lysophospholipid acyltransferase family protein n=1 Tax=Pelagicoccus mobilis TaxID=415221 RepID=A0A934VTI2_9BACT|nr:lysophospholipid acyltransferase family protein [Pelagicoccus mobilis]MBK1879544.1 lysophospholipid acyltransferase family protein [Pelagicoccus mobilis]